MTDEEITIGELGAYTNNSPNKEGLKKLVNKVNTPAVDAYTKTETDALLDDKQDVLTAGDGITITDNVISTQSSSDSYTKSETDDLLDLKQNVLTAGYGTKITNDEISLKNWVLYPNVADLTPLFNDYVPLRDILVVGDGSTDTGGLASNISQAPPIYLPKSVSIAPNGTDRFSKLIYIKTNISNAGTTGTAVTFYFIRSSFFTSKVNSANTKLTQNCFYAYDINLTNATITKRYSLTTDDFNVGTIKVYTRE